MLPLAGIVYMVHRYITWGENQQHMQEFCLIQMAAWSGAGGRSRYSSITSSLFILHEVKCSSRCHMCPGDHVPYFRMKLNTKQAFDQKRNMFGTFLIKYSICNLILDFFEATDALHWALHIAPYRPSSMVIEIVTNRLHFLHHRV